MKQLYIISVQLDEESIYFAELTARQADELRTVLSQTKYKSSVTLVRESPGFNSFKDLMVTFQDMAED